eukprot:COSAG04_NODE_2161_length_4653_cov_10.099473_4_plen_83_part_00
MIGPAACPTRSPGASRRTTPAAISTAAPADGPLTEEEFNKIPLEFVGQQGFRWGGGPAKGGSELFLYAHSSCSLAGYDRTSD